MLIYVTSRKNINSLLQVGMAGTRIVSRQSKPLRRIVALKIFGRLLELADEILNNQEVLRS